jgi:hypothetical protein
MSLLKNLINTFFGRNQKQEIKTQTPVSTTSIEPDYKARTLKEVQNQIFENKDEIDPFQFPTKKKRKKTEFKKPTKIHKVRLHLLNKGTIDSWTAIEVYGATRLSDIIFRLRGRGMDIESIPCSALDRNSNVCNYTTYKLNQ